MEVLGQVISGTIFNLDAIEIFFKNDSITEGPETATFSVRTGSISGPVVASSSVIVNDTSVYPAAGTTSGGAYCVGFNLYQNYHNGSGGIYASLRETNSASCGYVTYNETVTVQSDLWSDFIVPTNGLLTFSIGGGAPNTIFRYATTNNSDPQPTIFSSSRTLDGNGNFYGRFYGYEFVGAPGATGDKRIWVRFDSSQNVRSARILVVPDPGTLSGDPYCIGTTRYQNKHNGRGEIYAEVVQYNSTICGYLPQYTPVTYTNYWYYNRSNTLRDEWNVFNTKPNSSVRYQIVAGPILVGASVTVTSRADGFATYKPDIADYPLGTYTLNITFPGSEANYPSQYRTLVIYWIVVANDTPGQGY